jgi:hypothetical protein
LAVSEFISTFIGSYCNSKRFKNYTTQLNEKYISYFFLSRNVQ